MDANSYAADVSFLMTCRLDSTEGPNARACEVISGGRVTQSSSRSRDERVVCASVHPRAEARAGHAWPRPEFAVMYLDLLQ